MKRLIKLITNFKIILICSLCLFILPACAGHNMHSEINEVKERDKITRDSVTLKSSSMHEECFGLEGQQKLFYKFNSDNPLAFNVHFHADSEIHYPVQHNGMTQFDGMIDQEDNLFQLNTDKYYCLMWENPEMSPVNLSYECIVKME